VVPSSVCLEFGYYHPERVARAQGFIVSQVLGALYCVHV